MLCRLLAYAFGLCSVSACATSSPRDGGLASCVPGGECVVAGRLTFHAGQPPAWVAHLEVGDKCAKLALPDEFFENEDQRRRWNGTEVVATGGAFAQPMFDETDGSVTLWYEEGDRKIAMGMCDHGTVIFVEKMRSSSGMTWISP